MTANINVKDFLHDLLANRTRAKLTVQEFDKILAMADQIEKFSEKGLLILALTDQLHKMSNVNYVSIKKFMNEFLTGLKPEKPRRQRQPGEMRRRRVRPAQNGTNVVRNLEQMAQQSISNPSNLEMARLANGQTALQAQSQSNKFSQNMSKHSDINKKDLQFANQLNQISQGLEFNTNQDFQFQQGDQNIEEYSKTSSSSSQSFGVVSNFSQKMDLLRRSSQADNQKEQGAKTKTARRSNVEATITKKKLKANVVDENLTLQKTRATLNESVYLEDRSISYEYEPWIQLYHDQNIVFEQMRQQFIETIKHRPLTNLNSVSLSARKNNHHRQHFENIDNGDYTQFETGFPGETTMHDFTSQQMPEFSQEFINEASHQINQLSIFRYDQGNPTLREISHKVGRPEALVFYEMLSKMQKGEVVMVQEDAEKFGEIRVELLVGGRGDKE